MQLVLSDQFAQVLGARRGLPAAALPRLILNAREGVADEELDRLMKDAVAGRFPEPLTVLRACAHRLEETPPSRADVLCMTIATQMTERSRKFSNQLALALGWHPDMVHAFAAGLRSKMAQDLEPRLVECPPENWQEWLTTEWRERFPDVLAARLASEPVQSSVRLVGNGETFTNSASTPTSLEAWRKVAMTALTQPREHLLRPLGSRSIIACRQAAADTLRAVRDRG